MSAPLLQLSDDEVARFLARSPFADVCPKDASWVHYCGDVGRHAFIFVHQPRDVDLGWIVGVAWRPEGSVVSRPEQPVRLFPGSAFYYIIAQPPDGYIFVRQAREITPR